MKFDWKKKVLRDNFLSFLSSGVAWIDLKSSAALFEHSTCPVKHMTETGEHGVKNICSEFCFSMGVTYHHDYYAITPLGEQKRG